MRPSFNHVTNRTIGYLAAFLLLSCPHTASAITYMSIETVPNRDVVGEDEVVTIRSIGDANLERWSQRLLDECRVVDSVIDALTANAAISSVTFTNTRVVVAAGGFEGGTSERRRIRSAAQRACNPPATTSGRRRSPAGGDQEDDVEEYLATQFTCPN